MTDYVLAFIFTTDLNHVLLIRKKRPEWQRGLLNGLGGKVKENETVMTALVREVKADSGRALRGDEFHYMSSLVRAREYRVHMFAAFSGKILKLDEKPVDDGWLTLQHVALLPANIVSDLAWLIPKARAVLVHGSSNNLRDERILHTFKR